MPTHSRKSSSQKLLGSKLKRIEGLHPTKFEASRRATYVIKETPKSFAPVALLRMANEGDDSSGSKQILAVDIIANNVDPFVLSMARSNKQMVFERTEK